VNKPYRTPQTLALTGVSPETTGRTAPWRAVGVDAQKQADAVVDLPSADSGNGGLRLCP
jgi:hypothetical protein